MKIEEGKFYKNRAGDRVGPMKGSFDPEFPWLGINKVTGSETYRDDGTWGFKECVEENGDLISEWPTTEHPAIRTITRREIVPGVYGIVSVTDGGRVCIRCQPNADELREAATLFNLLADVLEEQG